MRKAFIAALLVSAGSFVVPAYATSTHDCRGNADCSTNIGGDTYNKGGTGIGVGIAGANSDAKAINHNSNTAHGGQGGKGGEAKAISGSISGAKVDNDVRNTNNIDVRNKSEVDVRNKNDVRNSNKQGQHQSSESNSQSSSSSSSDNANNASQSVNFEAQERNPVNTAYAPPLAVGEDTCMGSSSIGGQGVGFGISIGTTWTDENCQRLKNSRQLAALGFRRASVALLCVNDDVARAMAAAGMPCRVENGDEWMLTTVALPPDVAPQPRERIVYSRIVEDRPHFTPKKKYRAKKKRCRLVRQCR